MINWKIGSAWRVKVLFARLGLLSMYLHKQFGDFNEFPVSVEESNFFSCQVSFFKSISMVSYFPRF